MPYDPFNYWQSSTERAFNAIPYKTEILYVAIILLFGIMVFTLWKKKSIKS